MVGSARAKPKAKLDFGLFSSGLSPHTPVAVRSAVRFAICHIPTDCTQRKGFLQHTFLLLGQLDTYESVITDEPARTRAQDAISSKHAHVTGRAKTT
jgi:hypothetical protein